MNFGLIASIPSGDLFLNTVTVGVIGGGFVGSAVAKVFEHYTDVRVYDIDQRRRTHTLADVVQQDVLFLCLPTPMLRDGQVDATIVENALEVVRANAPSYKPVILKSTLPPEELRHLTKKFSEELCILFSPEFLTERTAELDFQQSTRFIFGAERPDEDSQARQLVELLFEERFPKVPRHWVRYEVASLVKYFTNVFFATKITAFNEFTQIAESLGLRGKEVIDLVMLDARIGRSHNVVPGHDGQRGFGGHCFLKDLNGYMHIAQGLGVEPTLGRATWNKNVEVRGAPELAHELNAMLGRAATHQMNETDVRRLGD